MIGRCQHKVSTDLKIDGRKSLHVSGSAIQEYTYRLMNKLQRISDTIYCTYK